MKIVAIQREDNKSFFSKILNSFYKSNRSTTASNEEKQDLKSDPEKKWVLILYI